MRRFLLLPGAAVAFLAAGGLYFFASAGPSAALSSLPGSGAVAPSTGSPNLGGGGPSISGAPGPVSNAPGTGSSATEPTVPVNHSLNDEGKVLFVNNCSSCHGVTAEGSQRGPNLVGLGPATVDFWVSTGRMPLANPSAQAEIKPTPFTKQEISAIVAYVTSLGPGGPGIPKLDLSGADRANGSVIFSLNCAPCHVITGGGDALSNGTRAPSLSEATATQIGEAVRTGPGQMPRFDLTQVNHKQLNDLVSYVRYLHSPRDRGGLALSHVGPVTEGLVALFAGMGGLMIVSFWIGDRI